MNEKKQDPPVLAISWSADPIRKKGPGGKLPRGYRSFLQGSNYNSTQLCDVCKLLGLGDLLLSRGQCLEYAVNAKTNIML